jgi:rubrerythrin
MYHFHPPITADGAGRAAYNRAVSETPKSAPTLRITPVTSALKAQPQGDATEATRCERCGAEMYRMHAVWRCPNCRFKTDCCGW